MLTLPPLSRGGVGREGGREGGVSVGCLIVGRKGRLTCCCWRTFKIRGGEGGGGECGLFDCGTERLSYVLLLAYFQNKRGGGRGGWLLSMKAVVGG